MSGAIASSLQLASKIVGPQSVAYQGRTASGSDTCRERLEIGHEELYSSLGAGFGLQRQGARLGVTTLRHEAVMAEDFRALPPTLHG
jgi:hypothetical protein